MKLLLSTILLLSLLLFTSSCKKKHFEPQPDPIEIIDSTGTDTNSYSKLIVNVSGMKNANGKLNFALYNSSSAFNDPSQTYKEYFLSVIQGNMIITIDSLPAGDYSFGLFHDENENYQIDKNWLGIPSEGFAFSNNAMGSFGPPSYNQAKFSVPAKSEVTQNITLNFY